MSSVYVYVGVCTMASTVCSINVCPVEMVLSVVVGNKTSNEVIYSLQMNADFD